MTDALRITVADDDPEMRQYLQETLSGFGHQVRGEAATGRELVKLCRQSPPDLVITDIKMPEMDGLEAAMELAATQPVPVILVSAYHDPQLIDRALHDHVFAYLTKPIKPADLETAIALAMQRFKELRDLEKEAGDLRQALSDRKLVERAKGILMKRGGLEEAAAFRRLQKLASEKNTKLAEIARAIVTAEEALQE